ncbi:MAG: (Fe-S)-binding protein [Candidatus Wallbacteria bacterium]
MANIDKIKVSLFIPCLINQFFPDTAFSMINVMKKCGIEPEVKKNQPCCGQPGYNMGFHDDAAALAQKFIDLYSQTDADYIVVPSGSCAAMVKNNYKNLNLKSSSEKICEKIIEFSDFMYKSDAYKKLNLKYKGAIFYHKSCHLLNELKIDESPKNILNSISGLKWFEADIYDNTCCGFGGSFSAAMPELSIDIGTKKLEFVKELNLSAFVACDAGCLMHLKSVSEAQNLKIKFYHFAEFIDYCSN